MGAASGGAVGQVGAVGGGAAVAHHLTSDRRGRTVEAPGDLGVREAVGRHQRDLLAFAADRADTTVEVLPASPSKSRDVQAAERTTVAYADGVLRIDAPEPKNQLVGPSGSLEVTVQLPVGSHVEGKAAASELRGVGRLGDVAFDGAYRQIKIDEAAGVRLTALDGDISVGAAAGVSAALDVRATTSHGDITARSH